MAQEQMERCRKHPDFPIVDDVCEECVREVMAKRKASPKSAPKSDAAGQAVAALARNDPDLAFLSSTSITVNKAPPKSEPPPSQPPPSQPPPSQPPPPPPSVEPPTLTAPELSVFAPQAEAAPLFSHASESSAVPAPFVPTSISTPPVHPFAAPADLVAPAPATVPSPLYLEAPVADTDPTTRTLRIEQDLVSLENATPAQRFEYLCERVRATGRLDQALDRVLAQYLTRVLGTESVEAVRRAQREASDREVEATNLLSNMHALSTAIKKQEAEVSAGNGSWPEFWIAVALGTLFGVPASWASVELVSGIAKLFDETLPAWVNIAGILACVFISLGLGLRSISSGKRKLTVTKTKLRENLSAYTDLASRGEMISAARKRSLEQAAEALRQLVSRAQDVTHAYLDSWVGDARDCLWLCVDEYQQSLPVALRVVRDDVPSSAWYEEVQRLGSTAEKALQDVPRILGLSAVADGQAAS